MKKIDKIKNQIIETKLYIRNLYINRCVKCISSITIITISISITYITDLYFNYKNSEISQATYENDQNKVEFVYEYLYSDYYYVLTQNTNYYTDKLEVEILVNTELNNFFENYNSSIDNVGLLLMKNTGDLNAESIKIKCEVTRSNEYYNTYSNDLYNFDDLSLETSILNENDNKTIEYITIPMIESDQKVAIPIFFTIKDSKEKVIIEYKPLEVEFTDTRNKITGMYKVREENESLVFSLKYGGDIGSSGDDMYKISNLLHLYDFDVEFTRLSESQLISSKAYDGVKVSYDDVEYMILEYLTYEIFDEKNEVNYLSLDQDLYYDILQYKNLLIFDYTNIPENDPINKTFDEEDKKLLNNLKIYQ